MVKKKVIGRKKKDRGELKLEDFKYHDSLGLTLPQLVLGIEVDPTSEYSKDYKFKPGRKWIKLAHQAAGHACNQHYLICTVLRPKSVEMLQNMQRLADKWEDSQAGWWGNSLKTVLEYQKDLKELLGVDCNICHGKMEEAFYPVDLDFVSKLAEDNLPNDLDDLIEWDSGWGRSLGCIGRWGLYIIGDNSD